MRRQMKDSGIEWFGMIPHEWKIVRVKRLFKIGRGRVIATTELSDKGFPVYSSQTKNNGILGYIDTYDFDRSQLTWTTDGANAGTVFLREGKHNCTNVCGTLMPYTMEYNLKYLKYILEYTAIFHKRADINGYKIMNNEMADIHILLPDQDSQNSIAEYLDEQYIRIDYVMEKIRASIAEYKKLKQAIITQAVTKGVRRDRDMRDSEVEWIGEIPKDWSCTQLGRFITIQSGISVGKSYSKETELVEVPYLRVANVQGEYVDTSDIATLFVTPSEAQKYRLHAGQLLMTEGGDRDKLGRGCLWNGEIDPCIHQNHIFAVETNELLDIRYLDYITTSDVARVYFDITAKKTTNLACTSKSAILKFIIPVPSKTEQIEIREYLDVECPKIDSIIEKKEKYLIELENYRKSLIYEYVTGKKEVPQKYQA